MKFLIAGFVFIFALQSDAKFEAKLYEIKEPSTAKVMGYLFGTWHSFVNKEDLPAKFWDYFKGADAYLCESKDGRDSTLHEVFLSRNRYKAPSAPTLDELLTKKELKVLKKYFPSHSKIDFEKMLYTYSTFGVFYSIFVKLNSEARRNEYKKLKHPERESLDSQLEKSVANNKPVISLDPNSNEHFECSYDTNHETNLQKLKAVLKKNLFKDLKSGKTVNIESVLNIKCAVNGRNQLWMPEILKHIKNQKTFIFVGAGHVAGDEPNLVSLLRKNGYDVSLVKL